MTTAVQKRASSFSEKARKALEPGKEISKHGLIYRKRRDGYGTWRYDFTEAGTRLKGVIGSDMEGVTLSQARGALSDIRAKAITDRLSGKTGRSTQAKRIFQEVALEYLGWSETHYQDHRHNVSRIHNHLLPHFATMTLASISTAAIETMRSALSRSGYNTQTIKRIVSLLSGIFEFARKYDPNLDNPTARLSRVKHQEQEVIPFSREETKAMFERGVQQYTTITRGTAKGSKIERELKTAEFRVIVGLALYAGLRASEALGLAWEQVDLERDRICVRQVAQEGAIRESTKNYKTRTVPITSSLKPILENLYRYHVESSRERGLLLSSNGKKAYNQIQVMFGRIKKQAGITREGGYHTLRHTFATRAAENGMNIPTLQKLLGHSDISVTMGYVHVTEDHMEAAASKLD